MFVVTSLAGAVAKYCDQYVCPVGLKTADYRRLPQTTADRTADHRRLTQTE